MRRLADFLAWLTVTLVPRGFVRMVVAMARRIHQQYVEIGFRRIGPGGIIQFPATIVGAENICVGRGFYAGRGLRLEAFSEHNGVRFTPNIEIGDGVRFSDGCHIGCVNEVNIGDGVLFAGHVFVSDHSHGTLSPQDLSTPPNKRRLVSRGPVVIEDNVWVGEGAVVLAGVTIGEGAVVGAHSVVTRDVPRRCVVAGAPARLLRTQKDLEAPPTPDGAAR